MPRNPFSVTVTRKRIKNLYLRVHFDGTVAVSAPKRCSDKYIQEFINSKTDWILMQLEKIEKQKKVEKQIHTEALYVSGEIHFLWGQPCHLVVEETVGRSSVTFKKAEPLGNVWMGKKSGEQENKEVLQEERTDGGRNFDRIHMYAPQNSTSEQRKHLLDEFYRSCLKTAISPLMEQYVRIVGKAPVEWRIRNMKTRWGTCNVRDKRIWLSLNLAKKEPRCLEYVIAHELTHLHEPNHSKAFWARMDRYYPAWREIRKLLNEK